jgi:hypothetical protein
MWYISAHEVQVRKSSGFSLLLSLSLDSFLPCRHQLPAALCSVYIQRRTHINVNKSTGSRDHCASHSRASRVDGNFVRWISSGILIRWHGVCARGRIDKFFFVSFLGRRFEIGSVVLVREFSFAVDAESANWTWRWSRGPHRRNKQVQGGVGVLSWWIS